MSLATDVRRTVRTGLDYLPKGQTLPEGVWRVRHRTLSHLLRAHVVGIFIYALATGNSLAHSLTEAGERIIQLYESWGRPKQAARWRARLSIPDTKDTTKP